MADNRELLNRIDAYCEAHGLTRSAFSELVTGHRALCTRLKQGRQVYSGTIVQVEKQLTRANPYSGLSTEDINELLE